MDQRLIEAVRVIKVDHIKSDSCRLRHLSFSGAADLYTIYQTRRISRRALTS